MSDQEPQYTPATQYTVPDYAVEIFGKPYANLTRGEQRKVDQFAAANATEMEKRMKTIKQCTELDVAVRKQRGLALADQLEELALKVGKTISNFVDSQETSGSWSFPDGSTREDTPVGMDVDEETETSGNKENKVVWKKTPGGSARRKVLLTETYSKILRNHAALLSEYGDMPGNKTTFVGKDESKHIHVTPDAFGAALRENAPDAD